MLAKINRLALFSFIFTIFLTGTVFPSEDSRKHAELLARIKQIKTVMIIPDVKMYEILAGGIKEYRDEWSSKAKENMMKAISETLRGKQIESKTVPDDLATTEELNDIQALYKLVSLSIRLHAYDKVNLFPNKLQDFNYSVGSIDHIMTGLGIDAVLFVDAIDEISSGSRKALMAAGVIAGALLGVIPMQSIGSHATSMGLLDRTGTVIWYNVQSGGEDMREPEGAALTAADLLSDLPGNIQ